jgi:hypothetical protein
MSLRKLFSIGLLIIFATAASAASTALGHDAFGSSQSKLINVIASNILERDFCEKPVPTFLHPALESRRMNMAQALSPRCSTPAGICFVQPPQPIGTPCACGQFQGTIIW